MASPNPILSRLLPGAEQIRLADHPTTGVVIDRWLLMVHDARPDVVVIVDRIEGKTAHEHTQPEAYDWLRTQRDAWIRALGGPIAEFLDHPRTRFLEEHGLTEADMVADATPTREGL